VLNRAIRKPNLKKIGLAILSMYLFILAIQLMKDGASTMAPYIRVLFEVDNPVNSLGFGWVCAYVILSGSPVAAVALAFLDAEVIGQFEALTMISGSRLGASFIVLFVGFLYVLRGHERLTGLSVGLLSFIITAFLHVPGLAIGYLMLVSGVTDRIEIYGGASLISLTDALYGPVVRLVLENLPGWLTFVGGVGVILVSFGLLDRALPDLKLQSTEFGAIPRLIYRPIVMFLMGLIITAISMSVSVSLTILVPLSARGYIRSENAVAYIMGANVSTFVDTLLVALLLNNPLAFTVVLVQMVSITIVSLTVLMLVYGPYERVTLRLTSLTVSSNRNLIAFAVIILITPIILMLV
jgi:sodium-dependent phosphate cotransporter